MSQASPKNKVALPLITAAFWGLTRPRIAVGNRSLYALLGEGDATLSIKSAGHTDVDCRYLKKVYFAIIFKMYSLEDVLTLWVNLVSQTSENRSG